MKEVMEKDKDTSYIGKKTDGGVSCYALRLMLFFVATYSKTRSIGFAHEITDLNFGCC